MEVRHQHIEQDQPQVAGEKLDPPQQGRYQKQRQKAGRRYEKTCCKNAPLIAVPLQPKADDGIGNPSRRQGDQQVPCLDQQIGDAILRAGEDAGIERRQQKGEKF